MDVGPHLETGTMRKKKTVELFVDGGNAIVDQDRNPVSIGVARSLWEQGRVSNYNLAFRRLATLADWDFEELARQFAEMDAARRK
jgi:hypothetical protein